MINFFLSTINVLWILVFFFKIYFHIHLARKYGRQLKIGGISTSFELFLFYIGEVDPKDSKLKKTVNGSYVIFFILLILYLLINFFANK